ncbi:unnamed protein product [Fusarium langsethiae]|nr:unnamed protein product [Fusarium langsethiae]
MLNHRTWRDSLEADRPFIRYQPIRFFTRMAAMERARILSEEVAAQHVADDAAGPAPAPVSSDIPPVDDLELDFNFGIESSSDGEDENHWETDSQDGSDLNRN